MVFRSNILNLFGFNLNLAQKLCPSINPVVPEVKSHQLSTRHSLSIWKLNV